MSTKQQVEAAIRGLDAKDDANWTASGLPSVEAVSAALGERVTREEITSATSLDRAALEKSASEPSNATVEGQEREAFKKPQFDPADYRDADGPEPEALFAILDQIATVVTSPRYRRNQVLQQIKLLWANEGKTARQAQDKMEGRIDRRAAKRDEKAKAEAEAAA